MVLVFGFTTGGVIEGGLLGSLGSANVELADPPPQATSNSDETRPKKTRRQATNESHFACWSMIKLGVDIVNCFALEYEYFIVGT